MDSMIERVAEVIQRWQGHPGVPASAYLPVARLVFEKMGEPTAEMLKGGMEVLEASQGEPLEVQVGRVWWEMVCDCTANARANQRGR